MARCLLALGLLLRAAHPFRLTLQKFFVCAEMLFNNLSASTSALH
jgi:hypothetical protein